MTQRDMGSNVIILLEKWDFFKKSFKVESHSAFWILCVWLLFFLLFSISLNYTRSTG